MPYKSNWFIRLYTKIWYRYLGGRKICKKWCEPDPEFHKRNILGNAYQKYLHDKEVNNYVK